MAISSVESTTLIICSESFVLSWLRSISTSSTLGTMLNSARGALYSWLVPT